MLDSILKGIPSGKQQDRTRLWSGLRSSEEFCRKWQQYLEFLHLRNEPIFYQHLTVKLFEHILCTTFKITNESPTDPRLNLHMKNKTQLGICSQEVTVQK